METILQLDEENDLLSTLELSMQLSEHSNEINWKWLTITIHNAMQTSFCMALVSSASVITRKRVDYNRYAKHDTDLDSVEWLYEKLKNKDFLPYTDSIVIPEDAYINESVKKLNEFRNDFIHFKPQLYIYTKEEILEHIINAIVLIEFLIYKSNRINFTSKEILDKIKLNLNAIKIALI